VKISVTLTLFFAAIVALFFTAIHPTDFRIWTFVGLSAATVLRVAWILIEDIRLRRERRASRPSREWLRKMADAEDAAGSVSVGGMAVDCGQPVRNREQLIRDLGRARMASELPASEMVAMDLCPKCGGELDTGWECNSCGFDAAQRAAT
jgi:hypothetical protein